MPKKNRSRAYPAVELESACELFYQVAPHSGGQPLERAAIAMILGYSTGSGGLAARKIAALVHYGFLARKGGSYLVSDFGGYFRGLVPESEEWRAALKSAFKHPALFRELFDSFIPSGRLPDHLSELLEQKHGITAKASHDVEKIFVASGRFAGALDNQRRFLSFVPQVVGPVKEPPREDGPAPHLRVVGGRQNPRTPESEALEWRFPLTNGKACTLALKLPRDLRDEDYRLLARALPFQAAYLKELLRPPAIPDVRIKSPWREAL